MERVPAVSVDFFELAEFEARRGNEASPASRMASEQWRG
jgi:hypothetical protein